ncbi:MAG: uracil-DNA glycosylase [Aquabacterium sp.]|uniref:uracil-DNA glycosylase n=1 Tax=Aquabacterium sp. TaxID=1872578 RepID=UPI0025C34781|nr:uracil-DNA glycosylase [Aquabacterium sp.]MBI3382522.1 uracil-DNA glycosylase [Aquabacterium sp.]
MSWTERQRAMLREIGIPPFWPVEAEPSEAPPAQAAAPQAADPDQPMRRIAAVAEEAIQRAAGSTGLADAGELPVQPSARPAGPAGRAPAAPARTSSAPSAKPTEVPLGPRPVGVETMDWPALRDAVASCQACSLCQSRTQAVFGVGNEQAQWMIVGEAPGEQEDKQGEPFVGRAGQLLDRMLAALDLTRAEAEATRQVFIANVLKCRPPANRNPQPQEVAQCEPYLLRQIALVQPKVILAMGRFAVQSLLKSTEPIGKLRGRVHEVAGVPVIVTYHPAYLLRSPADKALAWDDLCLAREVMRNKV